MYTVSVLLCSSVQQFVSAEEKMELHVFYAMQCKTCYSAVRVSVAGV